MRQHQRAHRQHSDKLLGVFLKHIHEMDGREVFIKGAQHFNRVKHSVGFLHGDKLGGHHAACSVVLIAEQGTNLGRILNAHQAKQRFSLFIRKVTNNIGCIVRVHLTQKARSLTVAQVVECFSLVFIFQLGDNLGRTRIVKVLEHLGALLGVELLQNVCDVGRVHLIQAAVRHGKLHLGQVAIEQVHIVPGNNLFVDFLAEELRRAHNGFLKKRMKAAQNTAHANFGAQKTQLRARRGELQVVNAHEFEALRVDDLLVEQIAGKQDFVRLQITEANVVRLGIKTNFVFRKTVDVLTPTNHEWRAARAFKRQRSNAWKHLACGNSEIRHNTELFSRRIVYGITQHIGQVEQSLPPLEQCGLRPTKESGGPQG